MKAAPSVFRPNEASSGDQMSHLTLQRQHFLPSLTGGVLTKRDGAPSLIVRPVVSLLTPALLQPQQQQRPSPVCSPPPPPPQTGPRPHYCELVFTWPPHRRCPLIWESLCINPQLNSSWECRGPGGGRGGGCLIVSEGRPGFIPH